MCKVEETNIGVVHGFSPGSVYPTGFRRAKDLWTTTVDNYSTFLIMKGPNVLGCLVLERIKDRSYKSHGTWVSSGIQRKGLGSALWNKAIHYLHPQSVEVYPSTKAGQEFCRYLAREHPRVDWEVFSKDLAA